MLKSRKVVSGGLLLLLGACGVEEGADEELVDVTSSALEAAANPSGIAESFHTSGMIDRTNPFFLELGINGRTCETCHAVDQDWTLSAKGIARLFRETDGLAALFRLVDAGTRPDADISTLAARRATFGPQLINKGLIRFGRTIPATAEFTVTEVFDPNGFATLTQMVSFRRPTPTVNEAKVTNTNWTAGPHDVPTQIAGSFNGAARFHAQRPDDVPVEQRNAGRDFLLGLFFAQIIDRDAGRLDIAGAKGGPAHLAAQPFHVGINDIQGNDPQNPGVFTRKVFNIYDAWAVFDRGHHNHGRDRGHDDDCFNRRGHRGHVAAARAAIYRGQQIFNHFEFDVSGVNGLNDQLGQPVVKATCSTCHNVPNVGGHAVFRMFDVGTADEPNCDQSILPMLTLRNNTTMETRRICEVGRGATAPGLWREVGAFRAPPLRGLAARAPYFHDGQARSIADVIRYFDRRFNIGFSRSQRSDLEAFLSAL